MASRRIVILRGSAPVEPAVLPLDIWQPPAAFHQVKQ